MESMLALKDLMDALGGMTECRVDGAALDPQTRAGYVFNSGIAGIERADRILLVGTDPRKEAPIIATRIRKAVRHKGAQVASIGPTIDLAHPVKALGDDAGVLAFIADGSHDMATWLRDAKFPAIVLGQGALRRADGGAILAAARRIAENAGMVREDWNGFNVLHTAAARVGALDIGFAAAGGMKAVREKARLVYLLGVDDIDTAAFKDAFVVYQGHHGDEGVTHADVILPGAAYTEKSGLYVNTEGRVQWAPRAVFPPGDAREDWAIIRALSDVLGKTLPYDSLDALRESLQARVPHFSEIDQKPTAAWGDFGTPGPIASAPIPLAVDNFYLTNAIARASATMAACVREILGEGGGEATGTHG
ncbi:MAG: hypothetical protein D6782_04020 [Alphaproteobacteria bacterium]|nr:MAG: hypothetical protein D6782_04020 [Alphaproteobacteria bacterium]